MYVAATGPTRPHDAHRTTPVSTATSQQYLATTLHHGGTTAIESRPHHDPPAAVPRLQRVARDLLGLLVDRTTALQRAGVVRLVSLRVDAARDDQ